MNIEKLSASVAVLGWQFLRRSNNCRKINSAVKALSFRRTYSSN
jgi:hypothetical protein